MQERIIEIILYVISELKNNKEISDIDIGNLVNLGYTNAEISTAISWLADRVEFPDSFYSITPISSSDSFRVLHIAEYDLFTQEAWGEVVQLSTLGLLSNEHIELLIDRATMMGATEIDTGQVRAFLANVLFNAQTSSSPGSRVMLTGSDLIH